MRLVGTNPRVTANVCRSESLPEDTPYISLSHCWGTAKFLTLQRANLDAFEKSLPVEHLSKTFQDAFLTTINLGFQYIWIDSLCIIQDDLKDWKRESQLMNEVFKHASCNISASGFSDGEKGFLLSDRRIDPTPVLGPVPGQPSGAECSENSNDLANLCYLVEDRPWDEIQKRPIYDRGWTVQEQLLVRDLA